MLRTFLRTHPTRERGQCGRGRHIRGVWPCCHCFPFEEAEDALRIANASDWACSSVWTQNVGRAMKMSAEMRYGLHGPHMVWVPRMPGAAMKGRARMRYVGLCAG